MARCGCILFLIDLMRMIIQDKKRRYMQIQTNAVHFKADSKLLAFIRERLGKLEQYSDRIIDAQVYLKLENTGQVKDKITEIRLNVPGDRLFTKCSEKTFEAAVDRAVESLRRSLKKYKQKQGS